MLLRRTQVNDTRFDMRAFGGNNYFRGRDFGGDWHGLRAVCWMPLGSAYFFVNV